jgi:hypothetical protein
VICNRGLIQMNCGSTALNVTVTKRHMRH